MPSSRETTIIPGYTGDKMVELHEILHNAPKKMMPKSAGGQMMPKTALKSRNAKDMKFQNSVQKTISMLDSFGNGLKSQCTVCNAIIGN